MGAHKALGVVPTLRIFIDGIGLRMSNLQVSNSSRNRLDYPCNQIANYKSAGSRSGHGKLNAVPMFYSADLSDRESV